MTKTIKVKEDDEDGINEDLFVEVDAGGINIVQTIPGDYEQPERETVFLTWESFALVVAIGVREMAKCAEGE